MLGYAELIAKVIQIEAPTEIACLGCHPETIASVVALAVVPAAPVVAEIVRVGIEWRHSDKHNKGDDNQQLPRHRHSSSFSRKGCLKSLLDKAQFKELNTSCS
jgi:hypothetical protein